MVVFRRQAGALITSTTFYDFSQLRKSCLDLNFAISVAAVAEVLWVYGSLLYKNLYKHAVGVAIIKFSFVLHIKTH